jgi:hypothetical protein
VRKIEYLYHYFEKEKGPFLNLSALSLTDAKPILDRIKSENDVFAAHRYEGYLERRGELERLVRGLFIGKGGRPKTDYPHYFVAEECPWLETWYRSPGFVRIPMSEFKSEEVSFSYGDMFPTFSERVKDEREYRKKIYTHDEILVLIEKYGLPRNGTPTAASARNDTSRPTYGRTRR